METEKECAKVEGKDDFAIVITVLLVDSQWFTSLSLSTT